MKLLLSLRKLVILNVALRVKKPNVIIQSFNIGNSMLPIALGVSSLSRARCASRKIRARSNAIIAKRASLSTASSINEYFRRAVGRA